MDGGDERGAELMQLFGDECANPVVADADEVFGVSRRSVEDGDSEERVSLGVVIDEGLKPNMVGREDVHDDFGVAAGSVQVHAFSSFR